MKSFTLAIFTLLFSGAALLLFEKPWPTQFKAIYYSHVIKDSAAKKGLRTKTDTIDFPVTIDYGSKFIQFPDTVYRFDSVITLENSRPEIQQCIADSERVFLKGIGAKRALTAHLDRRPGFPGGYRLLLTRGRISFAIYDLQPALIGILRPH